MKPAVFIFFLFPGKIVVKEKCQVGTRLARVRAEEPGRRGGVARLRFRIK